MKSEPPQLSNREWQVIGLLAKGHPNKRIADALGCKARTVASHIENIARELSNPDRLPARTLVMLFARDETNRAA